jgi:hypothetical protein
MKIEHSFWAESGSWHFSFSEEFKKKANLVFIFGNRKQIEKHLQNSKNYFFSTPLRLSK